MKKIVFIIITILIIISLLVYQISIPLGKVLNDLSHQQIQRFCQLVLNGVSTEYEEKSEGIIELKYDAQNNIKALEVDMPEATKIASSIVENIELTFFKIEARTYQENQTIYQKRLKEINDQNGVIAKTKIFSYTNSPFLSQIGPSIPIRYKSLQHVSSDVKYSIEEYGINHVMVDVYIMLSIHIKVASPFVQDEFVKEIKFPLALEIIQGEIPQWYQEKQP